MMRLSRQTELFYLVLFSAGVILACRRDWQQRKAELFARSAIQSLRHGDLNRATEDLRGALQRSEDPYYLSLQGLAVGRKGFAHYDVTKPDQFRPTSEQVVFLREALSAYSSAIALNPDDDILWHNRGWLRLALGDNIGAAEQDFQRATELDGGAAAYHYSLAYVYGRLGAKNEQVEQYAKAFEAEPDITESKMSANLRSTSRFLWEAGVNRAIAELKSADEKNPDVIIESRLASLYITEGSLEGAYRLLTSIASSFPQLPRVWRNLGQVYLAQGHPGKALPYIKKALALDPTDCIAWLQLSNIARARGNMIRANALQFHATRMCRDNLSSRARRVRRIYSTKALASNDLLPPGLLWYLETPSALSDRVIEPMETQPPASTPIVIPDIQAGQPTPREGSPNASGQAEN